MRASVSLAAGAELSVVMAGWISLNRRIVNCQRCPRLRSYCAEVARNKRRAFTEATYWGRPVANFGSAPAPLLLVGLAPAAHGANRTGRMFTGDRSGDWLFRALHKAGFATQPVSTAADDGLRLVDCAITAVCHCAPPANKPTREELESCREWLVETIDATAPRVFVALGHIAWRALVSELLERRWLRKTPGFRRPAFAHGARVALEEGRWLLGSYHPSQQNTFTGRLTEPMFDGVFVAARRLLS